LLILPVAGAGTGIVAQAAEPVTLYAAASVKEALDTLIKMRDTSASTMGAPARVVYAASSTLARQIEQGAPADIFISADNDWMDYLAQRRLLKNDRRITLLTNRLVLIAPAKQPTQLVLGPHFALAAALGNDRLSIADPDSVPAGKYAKAALQALGVWHDVSRKLAPAENVRAAMMLVARGEAPLGIVYASDAIAEPRVRVVGEFPVNSHPPIVYPAAVLSAARSGEARAWLDFLRSPEARAVWRKHGFGTPD
jgi:molybdate transport system substrate-binding protein